MMAVQGGETAREGSPYTFRLSPGCQDRPDHLLTDADSYHGREKLPGRTSHASAG